VPSIALRSSVRKPPAGTKNRPQLERAMDALDTGEMLVLAG
jgi:hypothetical protein